MPRRKGKKPDKEVKAVLDALFTVFCGDFDPVAFFEDNSQFDLMKLAVQCGRDGEITLETVMQYVQESLDMSEDNAQTFSVKLFRMLQKLADECELPMVVSSDKPARKPREKKTTKRKTTVQKKSATLSAGKGGGRVPVSDQVVKALGGDKESAIKKLKRAGSSTALAQSLRDKGIAVTDVNMSYILRNRLKINAKKVTNGIKVGQGQPKADSGSSDDKSRSPRKQAMIDHYGSEAKAKKALVKAISDAQAENSWGALSRAVGNLAESSGIKLLKKMKPYQITALRKSFDIGQL